MGKEPVVLNSVQQKRAVLEVDVVGGQEGSCRVWVWYVMLFFFLSLEHLRSCD